MHCAAQNAGGVREDGSTRHCGVYARSAQQSQDRQMARRAYAMLRRYAMLSRVAAGGAFVVLQMRIFAALMRAVGATAMLPRRAFCSMSARFLHRPPGPAQKMASVQRGACHGICRVYVYRRRQMMRDSSPLYAAYCRLVDIFPLFSAAAIFLRYDAITLMLLSSPLRHFIVRAMPALMAAMPLFFFFPDTFFMRLPLFAMLPPGECLYMLPPMRFSA